MSHDTCYCYDLDGRLVRSGQLIGEMYRHYDYGLHIVTEVCDDSEPMAFTFGPARLNYSHYEASRSVIVLLYDLDAAPEDDA